VVQRVGPTVIIGVPGFFDVVKSQVENAVGYDPNDVHARGATLQNRLGGRIRYLWTGSAPASRDLLDFYNGCGVSLYEGYGLNETCIVTKNHPGAFRIGSVGKPLPNKTVEFDADGIVIVAGNNPVNKHYSWCAPGDNEKMFLPDGRVKTHDLGYFDEDGYLYILGRADDIITLSSGRNVLVRPLEERLKEHPEVHECILCGTGKPFLTVLVSPGVPAVNLMGLKHHVEDINRTTLPEQQIKGLVVASERFSIENDLLTSQFKPKRRDIQSLYAREIEAQYE
jgi:long-chain acyl-CoA synthetase